MLVKTMPNDIKNISSKLLRNFLKKLTAFQRVLYKEIDVD